MKETWYNRRNDVLICLFIVIATCAVYWQVKNHAFVNYDDTQYVSENNYVRSGLNPKSITWAFTFSFKDRTYWHPLTWLSHMLDCQLYGLRPGAHHLTNLFFHIANSLLLFLVLRLMTGAVWRSAFVAAVFALHPINVDSVAWIAERKNVLSTSFWMLTMLAYARYSKQRRPSRYLLFLLLFSLGLLAKPMLVTLPFLLLLLDYWPLGRLRLAQSNSEASRPQGGASVAKPSGTTPVRHLILEKIPLLILSLITIYLSSLSLQKGDVIISMKAVTMPLRIANAAITYVSYIGKLIWPQNLTFFYPYPTDMPPIWQIVGAGLLLIGITVLTVRLLKDKPYLGIGWLWYLGTLTPVSGLIQGGLWPAMADRWVYVPFIGLFIIIAWGVPELLGRWGYRKMGLASLTAALLLILMGTTWLQIRYWTNSLTLCEHALNVTSNNYVAHTNLGVVLTEQGRSEEAISNYSEALRLKPDSVVAHIGLGNVLRKQGEIADAMGHYSQALQINPDSVRALNNLGVTLMEQGKMTEATSHFSRSVNLKPDSVEGHNNLGLALVKLGKTTEAIAHYTEALKIKPDSVEGHNNLGLALVKQARAAEAVNHYSEALRIDPDSDEAHNNLGNALVAQGKVDDAIVHYSEVLRINPKHSTAHNNLGLVLAEQGKTTEAINHYTEALRINPGVSEIHTNLGSALVREGKLDEAIVNFREALRIRPESAEAHNNLKKVLAAQGKIKEGISKFEQALKIMPENPALHYNLGNLYKANGQYSDAIDQYQKALSIQPGFIQAFTQLAGVHMIRKEYDKALLVFQNIIKLQPKSPGTYYNIACIYAKQNRVEESIDWLKKGIGRGYDNWALIKTDKDLENIRDSSHYKELIRGH